MALSHIAASTKVDAAASDYFNIWASACCGKATDADIYEESSMYEERSMQLFILIPTVRDEDCWAASDYLGEVIVRAPSAEHARRIATKEYTHIPHNRKRQQRSPWSDSNEVTCEPYVGWEYARSGNAEILYPKEFKR